jgi:hypothetical protein
MWVVDEMDESRLSISLSLLPSVDEEVSMGRMQNASVVVQ